MGSAARGDQVAGRIAGGGSQTLTLLWTTRMEDTEGARADRDGDSGPDPSGGWRTDGDSDGDGRLLDRRDPGDGRYDRSHSDGDRFVHCLSCPVGDDDGRYDAARQCAGRASQG